jgi:hypothetical protein
MNIQRKRKGERKNVINFGGGREGNWVAKFVWGGGGVGFISRKKANQKRETYTI